MNKPNRRILAAAVWLDDFIAVTEYLVKEKCTSPVKLGITGGSNDVVSTGRMDLAVSDRRTYADFHPGSCRHSAMLGSLVCACPLGIHPSYGNSCA